MKTIFTWDRRKADRNRRAHGVSFEIATQAFADPNQIVQENDFDGVEQRYALIGTTDDAALLMVVFVERTIDEETEVIRLISARRATEYEKAIYADQFR